LYVMPCSVAEENVSEEPRISGRHRGLAG
jgi:hypothetical protein